VIAPLNDQVFAPGWPACGTTPQVQSSAPFAALKASTVLLMLPPSPPLVGS
jgi:hypothetical protein